MDLKPRYTRDYTVYQVKFALLSTLLYLYAFRNLSLLDPHAIPIDSFLRLPERTPCPSLPPTTSHAASSVANMLSTRCTAYDLGDAFRAQNRFGVATLLYHEGLRHSPDQSVQCRGYASLAQIHRHLNSSQTAAHYARKAAEACSGAGEAYAMGRHFEAMNETHDAMVFYKLAIRASVIDHHLRAQLEDIDRRLMWPDLFPSAYIKEMAAVEAILNSRNLPEETQAQFHWDMVTHARPLLDAGQELFRKEGRFQDGDAYYYATPSILLHPQDPNSDHLILVRLLNYHIDRGGRYYKDYLPPNDSSGILRSSSALYTGHKAVRGYELRIDDEPYQRTAYRFMGTEDPKLFQMDNGDIRVIWISWQYAMHVGEGSRMVTGILDLDQMSVRVDHIFPSPFDRFLEKNWVLFQIPGGPLQVVYEWYPIRIGKVDNASDTSTIRLLENAIETPRSFRHVKGSTNGVYFRNELWFLVHGTTWHQGPGPVYYHRMVVLDSDTFALRRFTYPFKLESATAHVEFSLGMTIDAQERVTISYSVYDGSAVLRRIPLWKVESLMQKGKSKA